MPLHALTRQIISSLSRTKVVPEWSVVNLLPHGSRRNRLEVTKALHENKTTNDEVFKKWIWVKSIGDIDEAMKIFHNMGYTTTLASKTLPEPPPWVPLYLAVYKVRTAAQAHRTLHELALHLTGSTSGYSEHYKATLLIITTIHLARHNLIKPLKDVVDQFMTLPIVSNAYNYRYWNLLMMAMSRSPHRSPQLQLVLLKVLLRMEERRIKLSPLTYRALLSDRFLTVKLTIHLQERMVSEGVIPEVSHLERYLRVFAKNGLIEDAQKYHKKIRELASSPERSDVDLSEVKMKADISALLTHTDRTSAFDFLKAMTATPTAFPYQRRIIGPYQFTTALYAASRDPRMTPEMMIKLFWSSVTSTGRWSRTTFRPTAATYAVLIQYLNRHGWYRSAITFFHKMITAGVRPTSQALGMGVVSLIRSGMPNKALKMIKTYSVFPGHRPRVKIHILDANAMMVSLNMIRRPDVVWALWDGFYEIFDFYPDGYSLAMVIWASRIGLRLQLEKDSESILSMLRRGFQDLRKEKLPLNDLHLPTGTRETFYQRVMDLVQDPELHRTNVMSLRLYSPSWSTHAILLNRPKILFLSVVLSSLKEFTFTSPISRVYSDIDPEKPSLIRIFPRLELHDQKTTYYIPEEVQDIVAQNMKATDMVAPVDATFYHFLLFIANRPSTPDSGHEERRSLMDLGLSDIPLLLHWMRQLEVEPSRRTLTLFLMLWGECNDVGPALEVMASRQVDASLPIPTDPNDRQNIKKLGPAGYANLSLRTYLIDWLGADKVPNPIEREDDMRDWEFCREAVRIVRSGRGVERIRKFGPSEQALRQAAQARKAWVEAGKPRVSWKNRA